MCPDSTFFNLHFVEKFNVKIKLIAVHKNTAYMHTDNLLLLYQQISVMKIKKMQCDFVINVYIYINHKL